MTKVIYISLENDDATCKEVCFALRKLLDDTQLDDLPSPLKVRRITVQQQHGRNGVSDKAGWERD